MNFVQRMKYLKWPTWKPDIIALLGGVVYFVQSVLLAHTTISSLDEGGYLYKGFLFATGVYRPFQPYGVWTNKGPLAFLIPGYFQLLFGPGLRTGRYLAVLEGLFAVIAIWIVTRRMSNHWLAAGAVWVMASSTAVIKVYSVGATQALVACLLAWMLVFSLGENRPLWQLILSALLAGVSILVRQNMILVLPFLLLYIFWQHGWKSAAWSAVFGCGLFVIGHAIYWPQILQIWVAYLPVMPAQWSTYGEPSSTSAIWNPSVLQSGRVLSIFQGFRWHFIILTGSIYTLLFWPKTEKWWSSVRVRAMCFLGLLFLSLLYLHGNASVEKDYCVFCFAPYLSFFSVIGLVFVSIAISVWRTEVPALLQAICVLIVMIISAGMGYATFEDTGPWLTNLPFPRMREGRFLPGFNTVGEILFNKFDFDQSLGRRVSALGAGLLIGLFVILLVFLINNFYLKRKKQYAYLLVNVFLITGFILSPITQGSQGAPDCKVDVIAANEAIGKYLKGVIPPDSKVYWDGGLSVVPLLYAPQAHIYAPQINDGYAYREGGDADQLLKFGYWNAELASRWKQEADIIIIEEWRYQYWQSFLTPDAFAEFPRTPQSTSCLENTRLRIFKRN